MCEICIQKFIGKAFGHESQFDQLRASLGDDAVNFPFSMVSHYFVAETEYHQQLMIPGKSPDLDLTVEASELATMGPFDNDRSTRAFHAKTKNLSLVDRVRTSIEDQKNDLVSFPEGRRRHIFFDSIFYRDPETGEPVWLIYYRAFKDSPFKNQKPPKQPPKVEKEDESWKARPDLIRVR